MKKYFEEITDPRQQWKVDYKLHEIVVMTICAVMSGCEIWEEIADFCKVKVDWFRAEMGLTLENGVASHDTFQRVFQLIKPEELEKSFVSWVRSISVKVKGEIVSIDGKTICGSKSESYKAIHMVGAWSNANQLVLGQVKTDDKSNEITTIPVLLDLLELKNCIITIDAMGCQKEIAKKIFKECESDYVFGLKGNHEILHDDVKLYFETHGTKEKVVTKEKDHGRGEIRTYYLLTELDWLWQKPEWEGLCGIGMVKSRILRNGKICKETRYFITSLSDVKTFANAVRAHWGIENNLHWCLDVVFNEDASRTRKDNSSENFSVIRRIALNILKKFPANMSLNRKRRKCHYDSVFMSRVLFSVC
jgi:predicted transposase YbfD/YdcC